jgi:hypothetical protein
MKATFEAVPDDIDALRAALIAERDRATGVEAELAVAKAKASDDQAVIAHQQLQIAKLTRALYGQRSERTVRLLDQIELAFEELESSATEDEIAAERAAAKTTNVMAFTRKRPARQPFPEHLPRERVVEPRPAVANPLGRIARFHSNRRTPCLTSAVNWIRLEGSAPPTHRYRATM